MVLRQVAFWRIVDDVGKRHVERLAAERNWIGLLRLGDHPLEERRIHRGRLFADEPRQRRAFGSVALARRAQATEQMHLEAGGLRQLIGRQFCAALIEVVGNARRAYRRCPSPHLIISISQKMIECLDPNEAEARILHVSHDVERHAQGTSK